MDVAIQLDTQEEENQVEASPRTGWDRTWYVITSTIGILSRLAQWLLGFFVGLQAAPVISEVWNGQLSGTLGIMLGLTLGFAVTEFIAWGWREAIEWVLAWLEVRAARPPKEIDDASPELA